MSLFIVGSWSCQHSDHMSAESQDSEISLVLCISTLLYGNPFVQFGFLSCKTYKLPSCLGQLKGMAEPDKRVIKLYCMTTQGISGQPKLKSAPARSQAVPMQAVNCERKTFLTSPKHLFVSNCHGIYVLAFTHQCRWMF